MCDACAPQVAAIRHGLSGGRFRLNCAVCFVKNHPSFFIIPLLLSGARTCPRRCTGAEWNTDTAWRMRMVYLHALISHTHVQQLGAKGAAAARVFAHPGQRLGAARPRCAAFLGDRIHLSSRSAPILGNQRLPVADYLQSFTTRLYPRRCRMLKAVGASSARPPAGRPDLRHGSCGIAGALRPACYRLDTGRAQAVVRA